MHPALKRLRLILFILEGLFTCLSLGVTPDFQSIKKEIFERSCLPCHGTGTLAKRVPLAPFQALMDSARDLVVRNHPEDSGLWIALTRKDSKSMPPEDSKEIKVPKVSEDEIAVIEKWIKNGAPEFDEKASEADFYRKDLVKKILPKGRFKFVLPGGKKISIAYRFAWDKPKSEKPTLIDIQLSLPASFSWEKPKNVPLQFLRLFQDRIFLQDESQMTLDDEELPLTCVYVDGKDTRFAPRPNAVSPDFFMKVYLVVGDYTCTGPRNVDLKAGPLRETWDTYLYYEIRDTKTMFPVDAVLRYRGNDLKIVMDSSPEKKP